MKRITILLMILSFLTIVLMGGAENTERCSVSATIISQNQIFVIDSVKTDTLINLN